MKKWKKWLLSAVGTAVIGALAVALIKPLREQAERLGTALGTLLIDSITIPNLLFIPGVLLLFSLVYREVHLWRRATVSDYTIDEIDGVLCLFGWPPEGEGPPNGQISPMHFCCPRCRMNLHNPASHGEIEQKENITFTCKGCGLSIPQNKPYIEFHRKVLREIRARARRGDWKKAVKKYRTKKRR